MILSVIVPVYKRVKELERFLSALEYQASEEFEVIFVVDAMTEDPLASIDEYFKQGKLKKENIKLVFNIKRVGRTKALDQGIQAATGDYIIFMNPSNHFDKKLISELKKIISEKQTDIIEFRAAMKSPVKFEGRILKNFSESVNIAENHEVLAYTYKFDFNKIFKTEVLRKASQFKFSVPLNSRYSLEHAYKSLFFASTYSNVDRELVVSVSDVSDNFSPLKDIRQWIALKTFMSKSTNDEYNQEWQIAFARHILFFTTRLVKLTKNKILINKFNAEVKKELQLLEINANHYVFHTQVEEDRLIPGLIERL